MTPEWVAKALRALGHHVESVRDYGLEREKDDASLVAWARMYGFVFLTFDELRGEQGHRVNYEIRQYGGKVVHVGGGPQQPPERAVGRILYHWPEWFEFLAAQDGRADLHDVKNPCKLSPRSSLRETVVDTGARHFDEYLQRIEEAKSRPLKPRRRKRPDPRQKGLYLPDPPARQRSVGQGAS